MEHGLEQYRAEEVLESVLAVECLRLVLGGIVEGRVRPDFGQLDDGQLSLGEQGDLTDDQQPVPFQMQGKVQLISGQLSFCTEVYNPPFGNVEDSRWKEASLPGETRLENVFLRRYLEQKKEGQCCCLVPNGLLSRIHPSDVALRRQLVEQHRLQAVVLLPLHAFQPRVHVYTALLIFRKGGGPSKRVWLCDARNGRLEDVNLDAYFTAYFCPAPDGQPIRTHGVEHLFLTPQMLAGHQTLLVPEGYRPQVWIPSQEKAQEIQAEMDRLDRAVSELEKEKQSQQLDLFGGEEQMPWGKKKLGRMLTLKRKQMACCRRMVDQLFQDHFAQDIRQRTVPMVEGKELFVFHSGNKPHRDWPEGPYPVYDGSGIRRTLDRCVEGVEQPVLIITRVGTNCGMVYRSQGPCWVGGNAFYLERTLQPADPGYLAGLFSYMNFNQYKAGSCIPQINQTALLSKEYPLPPLDRQEQFGRQAERWLTQLDHLERQIYDLQQRYRRAKKQDGQ